MSRCCNDVPERLPALVLLALLLGACGAVSQPAPGMLAIRGARVDAVAPAAVLELALDCQLSGPMQDALEHGIPLTFRIDLAAGRWPTGERMQRTVELRYYPLSRRYQLRESGSDDVRSFTTRAALLAAFGSLRLRLPAELAGLPGGTRLRVGVTLEPAALPGALRLPALFEPAWRLSAKDYAWHAP